MSERNTSESATGYRSEIQLRRLARSASAVRRIRALDHDDVPTGTPPAPETPRTAPARKTTPRHLATRRIEQDAEPFRDTEPPSGENGPAHDLQRRPPADGSADGPRTPEPDEFPEPALYDLDAEFRAPAIRDAGSLPPTLSIVEAGEWLGIGRTVAYELARDGAFPVRTIRVGSQRRVITVELLAMLGIPLGR